MIIRKEVHIDSGRLINKASQTEKLSPVPCEGFEYALLLLKISTFGSPGGGDTLTFTPLFIDDDMIEHVDGNTIYGSFTIAGNAANLSPVVEIPYLPKLLGLQITGTSGLSSSKGFAIDARLLLIANTPGSIQEVVIG